MFIIAGVAETNRTPFDLVEAESELTAGFPTEYSGMRFALFFLAEYANIFASRRSASSLFLGGYHLFGWSTVDPWIWIFMLGMTMASGLRVRLGARHAAAAPLRSVDALRLEAPAARSALVSLSAAVRRWSLSRCSPCRLRRGP